MPRPTVSGIFKYLREFCNETTLHGLIHVVTPRRHWCERALWVLIIIASVFASCWIVASSWDRYSNNPTVISLDKDFRSWLTPFPASTVCFSEKVDEEKAAASIRKIWNVTEGKQFDYYMKFIKAVANGNSENFQSFQPFDNDDSLKGVDLVELTLDVLLQPDDMVSNTMTLGGKVEYLKYNWSAADIGFCLTAAAPMAYLYGAAISQERSSPADWNSISYCDYAGLQCTQSTPIPSSGEVYHHSPFEIADMSTANMEYIPKFIKMIHFIGCQAFTSSPDIRKLWPKQRRCYYYDENIYENIKGYSYNLCRINCRRQFIIELCGCTPHFYPKKYKNPVCDIEGLLCIAKNASYIDQETKKGGRHGCECYPPCEQFVYSSEGFSSSVYRQSRYITKPNTFGKTRYSRGIIFEFSDLLVSFGGTAALFLGCSLITGIEIIYFFTIRLCRLVAKKTKSGRNFMRSTFSQNVAFRSQLMAKHTAKISTSKMY